MLVGSSGLAGTDASAEVSGIDVHTADGVRTITFARPQWRNAMNLAMFRAYYDALAAASAAPEVRAIVVTGGGGSFCAGADPALLDDLRGAEGQQSLLAGLGYPPHFPLTVGKPVIAAINGSAAGLGLVHALYADVRFMAERAVVSTVFSKLGLIAEYGAAWLLPRLVGVPNALDMLLSARKIDAAEALRMGLVQRVLPSDQLLPAALGYAKDLAASCSPTSMAVIKRQVWSGMERPAVEAIAESATLMAESFVRPDFPEAIAAVGERRKPKFGALEQSSSQ